MRPEYAVISVGKENTYGHPSRRVLKRLERAGAEVWRTDEQGDIAAILGKHDVILEQI